MGSFPEYLPPGLLEENKYDKKGEFSCTEQIFPQEAHGKSVVGYSRAVKIGRQIWIAGTTAIDTEGKIVGKNDAELQTRHILDIIRKVLEEAGSGIKDIVRTRIYVRDIKLWNQIGRVHGEVFKNIRPATTMIEINALVDPDMLVEIEADAYIGNDLSH